MLVEVDPEVRGEDERETATLLESGLALVGGEVGADEGGVGAVEDGDQAVRRPRAGDVQGLVAEGAAHEGEVDVGEGGTAGTAAPFPRAGGEEEAQPLDGARDKSCMSTLLL